MKYVFSPEGLEALRKLKFEDTLYAFDFDGTLAPIVQNPEEACMSQRLQEQLSELGNLASVAIISGRSVDDVKSKIGFKVSYFIGNHGMEGVPGIDFSHIKERAQCWKSEALASLVKLNQNHNIILEDKGLSLSVHFQKALDPEAAEKDIDIVLGNLPADAKVMAGKKVKNIIPSQGLNKGGALLEIFRQSGKKQIFYIGDDVTDEDVFKLNDPRILTVRVGKDHLSQATFYIDSQLEMDRILEQLLVQ